MIADLPKSVHARLVQHAKRMNVDPNLVRARYGAERFLYRLSCSQHADHFVLKGALLLLVWLGEMVRPTRDADLLGLGELDVHSFRQIVQEICQTPVEPDGLVFAAETVQVNTIRQDDPFGGLRAKLDAHLGKSRILVQVDVGIGDVITPAPEWLEYPTLLQMPSPRLLACTPVRPRHWRKLLFQRRSRAARLRAQQRRWRPNRR